MQTDDRRVTISQYGHAVSMSLQLKVLEVAFFKSLIIAANHVAEPRYKESICPREAARAARAAQGRGARQGCNN